MNEEMIKRWNQCVGKFDKVFHLGDFCFGRQNLRIADRLNGQKRLILGNHDVYGGKEYLTYFLSLHGALFWHTAILTHIPVRLDDDRAKVSIHGHMHSKKIDDPRYINVSVEQNNLTPINADVILDRIKWI